MEINLTFIIQILSIIVAIFGLCIGIYRFFDHLDITGIFSGIYTVIFAVMLFLSEFYIFPFFKYFSFLLTVWGKAAAYIFMGFFVYGDKGVFLAAAIIYWIIGVCYVVLAFFVKGVSRPLFQKTEPDLSTETSQFFETKPTA